MTERFQIQDELPALNCTREDIYAMVRSLLPTNNVIDDDSLVILSSKLQAGSGTPRWRKYTVAYTAILAAATSEQEALFTLPAGGIVHAVKIKHSAAFAGTGITALTASVGIAGDGDKYAAAFDVFQAAGDAVLQLSATPAAESHDSGGTAVVAEFTSTGANLSALTAGSVDIFVLWSAAT